MPFNAFNSIAKLPKKTGGVPVVNWVAIGSGNTIVTSADGITWRDSTTKGGISSGATVAYGKDGTGAGLWVATGPGIATSTDGTNWTAVPTASTSGFSSGSEGGIAYGKDNLSVGIWVAGGNGTNKIVTSRFGTADWLPATSGITTCYRLAYNGVDKWVACGDGSVLATSSNGTNWTAVPSAKLGGISLALDVAYGNGLWVAVGSGRIVYSNTNGTDWAAASGISGFSTFRSIAYGNELWVAVGSNYSSNQQRAIIAYSSTGSSWTTVPTGSMGGLYASGDQGSNMFSVTYGNGLWVAGGTYGSRIATSTTGTNWNAVPSNGGITTARSIAYKPPV